MDISILGRLEINDDTEPVDVGGRRERAIGLLHAKHDEAEFQALMSQQ